LATALAVSASRQRLSTLLVDADPIGTGISVDFGWSRLEELTWRRMADDRGRVAPPALAGFPRGDATLGLDRPRRSPMEGGLAAGLAETLDRGRRRRDHVVVDLPWRLSEAALLAMAAADTTLLVIPAELASLGAVRRAAERALALGTDLRAVIRGRSASDAVDLADRLRLRLAGLMRPSPAVDLALLEGELPAADGSGPLAGLCRGLLADVRARRVELSAEAGLR